MHEFHVVLGDWSGDGHCQSDNVLIRTDQPMDKLQKAYLDSCEKTNLAFHKMPNKIIVCNQNSYITWDLYDELVKMNCPFIQNYDGNLNRGSFIELLMWFIGLSIDFNWDLIHTNIPKFNGYWQDDMNFQLGYGLYND